MSQSRDSFSCLEWPVWFKLTSYKYSLHFTLAHLIGWENFSWISLLLLKAMPFKSCTPAPASSLYTPKPVPYTTSRLTPWRRLGSWGLRLSSRGNFPGCIPPCSALLLSLQPALPLAFPLAQGICFLCLPAYSYCTPVPWSGPFATALPCCVEWTSAATATPRVTMLWSCYLPTADAAA